MGPSSSNIRLLTWATRVSISPRPRIGAPEVDIQLRDEGPLDVPAIRALITEAFLNAPHTSHTEQHIVDQLRRSGALTISLVAELDSVLIGHVAMSPVSISDGSQGWFGLGPISVKPQYQRRGIGSQLIREVLRRLRLGASGCVVLGEPEYYGRFGFVAVDSLVLPGVPPEYFQALAFDSTPPSGIVTYHDAFNA